MSDPEWSISPSPSLDNSSAPCDSDSPAAEPSDDASESACAPESSESAAPESSQIESEEQLENEEQLESEGEEQLESEGEEQLESEEEEQLESEEEAQLESEEAAEPRGKEKRKKHKGKGKKHKDKEKKHKGGVETFDPNTFGSLEEHAKGHAFPAHVATCGPCKFWKHRWEWTAQASFVNEVTNQKETWLGCKKGFAICLVCAAFTGAGRRDKLAEGTGSFMRWHNIRRHGNLSKKQKRLLPQCRGPAKGINWTHELAVRAWNQRARATALGADSATVAEEVGTKVTISEKHDGATEHQSGYRAFIFSRTLLQTKGSFRSFEQWSAAAAAGDPAAAVATRWQCTRRLQTFAAYERFVTQLFLKAGSAHRLQADGLGRAYQVEIGTVVWRFPPSLRYFQDNCGQFPWLTALGDRGPWLVERVIGIHEFPDDMGTDGKVSMLETCVRSAAVSASADLDVELHKRIQENVRVWTSDGADRDVGLAATGSFPNLVFHAWDESHSAGRLLKNAIRDDSEICLVDSLLVTGKKPQSLAKFLSTSDVFKKKFGDAQQKDGVAFIKNFGWAPQRFESRAKPYARECRRWKQIWTSVAAEAAEASDKTRKELAESFLTQFGGEYSRRLLLAGFLADLAVEHYNWVASGDKANPDTTTVVERANSFCHRLEELFVKGLIVALPNTYTGETIEFLKENSYYHYRKRVRCFGLGDWKESSTVKAVVKAELKRVQVVVANIRELLKVYRPNQSWFNAFAAFALPSPLGAAASASGGGEVASAACRASLERICSEAKLPKKKAMAELERLLPRAEVFCKNGCNPREAWARASAEFPEMLQGRALVELFLIWKTSTGNVERRFRIFREIGTPQRARLLDVTVEACVIADQAPSSKMLQSLFSSFSSKAPCKKNYLSEVEKLHETLHGEQRLGAGKRAQRRDAGVSRAADSARDTEAAFARKRAAAISAVVTASPTKRARLLQDADVSWAQSSTDDFAPAPALRERVAKRVAGEQDRFSDSAGAAAKARAKRENHVTRSSVQPANQRDLDEVSARPAGVILSRTALASSSDRQILRRAHKLHFDAVHDPIEFVEKAAASSRASNRGNVVLASPSEISDFAVCARIVAVIMGAYFADPKDFLDKGRDCGCQYKEKYNGRKTFRCAVSAAVGEEFPTLPHVLKAIAMIPGGCFEFYSPRKLCKLYQKEVKEKRKIAKTMCVVATDADKQDASKKTKAIFLTREEFLGRFEEVMPRAVCPGVHN